MIESGFRSGYAGSLQQSMEVTLPVTEPDVIRFLQSLRDNGVPAWQRLQAARAIEAYGQHILQTEQPSLREIKRTLQRLAADERDGPRASRHTMRRAFITSCLVFYEWNLPKQTAVASQSRSPLKLWRASGLNSEASTTQLQRPVRRRVTGHLQCFRESE